MVKLSAATFRSVPDPALLYLTDQHARALAFLQMAMRRAGCLATIVGEEGCGKTLLVSAAINDAGENLIVIQLDGLGLNDDQLMRETLTRLQPAQPGTSGTLPGLTAVRAALAEGRDLVVFVISNAQFLTEEVFQSLQALSRPEQGRRRRVSLVLTGQDGLETLIYTIGRNVLSDWKMLMAQLPPLSLPDVTGYIAHRLSMGGSVEIDSVFDEDCLAVIHRLSDGIPVKINELCDKAIDVARHATSGVVTAAQVRAAASQLGWPGAESDGVVSLTDATAVPTLTMSREGELLGVFPLERERTLIGRDDDNEVPVDSPYVSRHHTLIVRDERGFWITDINSTNGTYLNGERVSKQTRLGAGDHIRIGRHELIVSLPRTNAGLQGVSSLQDSMAETLIDPQEREDPKMALAIVDEELAANPEKIELLFKRGCLLTDLGRKDEAIGVFEQITHSNNSVPEVHNNLAVLLAERGDLLQARAELEKALRLAPAYDCAQENLGDIYLQLATTAYESALETATDKEACQRKLAGIARLLRHQPD